jgi:hypothetical protein
VDASVVSANAAPASSGSTPAITGSSRRSRTGPARGASTASQAATLAASARSRQRLGPADPFRDHRRRHRRPLGKQLPKLRLNGIGQRLLRRPFVLRWLLRRQGPPHRVRRDAQLPDRLDRHLLGPVQPTDLRPVLHGQSSSSVEEGAQFHPSTRGIYKLDPADVVTTAEAARLLEPLIRPLPAYDETVLRTCRARAARRCRQVSDHQGGGHDLGAAADWRYARGDSHSRRVPPPVSAGGGPALSTTRTRDPRRNRRELSVGPGLGPIRVAVGRLDCA